MSRTITIQSAATFIPSSYNSSLQSGAISARTTGSYNVTSGYHGSDNTSAYAQFSGTTQNSDGYGYYEFNITGIPSNATVTSVQCTARARANSNNRGTFGFQICYGTTERGTEVTGNTNTSTVYTLTAGTWTLSELSNLKLRIRLRRTGTSTFLTRFYGATLTINYTVSGTEYEVSFNNSTYYITTEPSTTQYVFQGGTQTIKIKGIDSINHFTITDNSTNIKSSLVQSGTSYLYTISNISADHTIALANTGTFYDVNASSTYAGATVSPTSKKVPQGNNHTVTIVVDNLYQVIVKDNGTVVTPSEETPRTTVGFIPSSYNSELTSGVITGTSQNPTNGCANSGSTTEARFSGKTQGASGYAYYDFSITGIPEHAIITSVDCVVRTRIYNNSYGKTAYQLCNGTTPKGSPITITSTTTTGYSLTTGEWTLDELENLKLRITVYRSSTTAYHVRFYGASLAITYYISPLYTINNVQANHTITVEEAPKYAISATSRYTGATIVPQEERIYAGLDEEFTITVDDISNIRVIDNSTDVTSDLEYVVPPQESSTFTGAPTSYDSENSTYDGTYTGSESDGLTPHTSTTRICAYVEQTAYGEAKLTYDFDCSSIPQNAIITSVTCIAAAACYSNGDYFGTKTLQLYNGNTAKGTAVTITGNGGTSANHTINGGPWTRSELNNIKIVLHIVRGNNTTQASFSFWGATLTIEYTLPSDPYYTYTITNISSDHKIVLREPPIPYANVGGSWSMIDYMYKKVNGSWVKQTDFSAVFDPNGIYILKN